MLTDKIPHKSWDERRDLVIPGDYNATMIFCLEHFIRAAQAAIKDHGHFCVALSGGSTPKEIFQLLCSSPYKEQLDWTKLHLFWSDERSVPPSDQGSNYHMAMEAGFKTMPIPPSHIHRMVAESAMEKNALAYEKTIQEVLEGKPFDLIMLGMGEDGHTASLFPHTKALKSSGRWVVANEVSQKNTWRMTFTYDCINSAHQIAIYVLGAAKKYTLAKVLTSPDQFDLYPIQRVGTPEHKALWIADEAAASLL